MKLLDYNGILSKRYALVAVFSILALLAFASSAMAGCCFLNNYQISISKPSAQECSDAGGIAFFDADCSKPALTAYTQPLCCVINVSNTFKCYYGSLAYFNYTRYSNELMQYDYVCRPGDYGEDGYNGCISDPMGGCPSPAPTPKCSPLGCLNYLSSSLYCTYSGAIISNCSYCLENDCGGLVCNQETGQCENLGTGCSATGYSCCASCADENKQNSTFNYDSSNPSSDRCPSNAPKCCESCAAQTYCCEYNWQCQQSNIVLPNTCNEGKTECSSACAKPQCVPGQKINGGLNTYPACWCDGQERDTATDSKYCCSFGVSDAACGTAALSVYGTIKDADTNSPVEGAIVIVDGAGVGSEKTGSNGNYQIRGLPAGEYTFVAYSADYYISSAPNRQITSSPLEINFTIRRKVSPDCSAAGPSAITGFNATHAVQGRVDVRLFWDQKCQLLISAYYLRRNDWASAKIISPSRGEYIDKDGLNWNTTYTYKIWAVYKSGASSVNSTLSFRTGSALCEGVYVGDEFCAEIVNGKMQKNTINANFRRTCNSLNQVVDSQPALYIDETIDGYEYNNCSRYGTRPIMPENRICALSNSLLPGRVLSKCILSKVCESSGNPFGLFYSENSCSQDFCFYDFSRTTVNSCNSCRADLTCSDFSSADSCEKNSCGINCTWEYTNPELERGICYSPTGNASSCDECNSIFSGCTEQDCAKLGSCMMKDGICSECSSSHMFCINYTSQEGCENNPSPNAFEKCDNGQLLPLGSTNDACRMLRCVWNGTGCMKDGNYDGINDCTGTTAYIADCTVDNTPAVISVTGFKDSPQGVVVNISASEGISKFAYCLDSQNACCPDISESFQPVQTTYGFVIPKDSLSHAGTHYLRYYSVDKYHNQETIRSYPIEVISGELGASLYYYFADVSSNKYNLTVLVDIDDLRTANCSYAIDKDAGSKVVKNTFVVPAYHFEADFANLNYSNYLFYLNCTSGDLSYDNYYHLTKISSSKFNISVVTSYSKDGLPIVTNGSYNVLMNFSEGVSISSLSYGLLDGSYSKEIEHSDVNGRNWNFTMEIPSNEAAVSGINKPAMIAVTANTGSGVLTENDANSPYFLIDTKAPEVIITIT